jgi:hypothetical protein
MGHIRVARERSCLGLATRIGSLPRVGALDQLRAAAGDGGFVDRVRSNPRLVVAIAAGVVLLLAWIGWAIYVTGADGATAGLGVVIAWPAMLAALALISLPFIGGYLLIRRLMPDEGEVNAETVEAEPDDEESDDDTEDEPEDSEDDAGEEDEEEGSGDDEDDESDEKEPEEAKSS